MPIQAVNERLDGWLVQMAQIGGCLPWLLPQHHCLWIDEPAEMHNQLNRVQGTADLTINDQTEGVLCM